MASAAAANYVFAVQLAAAGNLSAQLIAAALFHAVAIPTLLLAAFTPDLFSGQTRKVSIELLAVTTGTVATWVAVALLFFHFGPWHGAAFTVFSLASFAVLVRKLAVVTKPTSS
jgi:hypothetical protein